VNRRDSGPARHTPRSAGGYPEAEGAYLDAEAYPVDPGYQGFGGEPRPADVPLGAMRTRPDRAVPPRASRQAPEDPVNRPWQFSGDAPPGVGRPRPAAGRPRRSGSAPGNGPYPPPGAEFGDRPFTDGPQEPGPRRPGGHGPGPQGPDGQ
jgi:hypothetical protein